MHNDYKEHFLYNYKPEQINSVYCLADDDYVTFHIGKLTYIECGDSKTARIVYDDVCSRLRASGKFIKVHDYLINISNVEDIELRHYKSSNDYTVRVLFKGNDGTAICDNCVNALNIYNYLTEKLNCYKINNKQSTNCDDMINK